MVIFTLEPTEQILVIPGRIWSLDLHFWNPTWQTKLLPADDFKEGLHRNDHYKRVYTKLLTLPPFLKVT